MRRNWAGLAALIAAPAVATGAIAAMAVYPPLHPSALIARFEVEAKLGPILQPIGVSPSESVAAACALVALALGFVALELFRSGRDG